jgi:hypothetical protein
MEDPPEERWAIFRRSVSLSSWGKHTTNPRQKPGESNPTPPPLPPPTKLADGLGLKDALSRPWRDTPPEIGSSASRTHAVPLPGIRRTEQSYVVRRSALRAQRYGPLFTAAMIHHAVAAVKPADRDRLSDNYETQQRMCRGTGFESALSFITACSPATAGLRPRGFERVSPVTTIRPSLHRQGRQRATLLTEKTGTMSQSLQLTA